MKKRITFLMALLTSLPLLAEDIAGQWHGVLNVQGIQLRLVFNIAQDENGLTATMDSPDQGAKGIPVSQVTFDNNELRLAIKNAGISYIGQLKQAQIVGTFKQNGLSLPLQLSQKPAEKKPLIRPQEPSKPYPYHTETVSFPNPKAGISLSGTLALPKKTGNFPAVILISGSGPQNRDEEILGHKPFLIISDHLVRNGMAVLRYDDRGVGESSGDFKTATTTDFATDTQSAFDYLASRAEINPKKIGLIGHSEGGIIASMVAAQSTDVSFIILLAGPGVSGDQILLKQQSLIAKTDGASEAEIAQNTKAAAKLFAIVAASDNLQKLKTDLTNTLNTQIEKEQSIKVPKGTTQSEFVAKYVAQLSSPWMQHFIQFDPYQTLTKVNCPVLAVNGEKDWQVSPQENLTAIKKALTEGGNNHVTTIEFPNLNHLFQESKTGSPAEYGTIEQTISPSVLKAITKWIKNR